MFVIGKTFGFAAAHHLPQLPDEHKCRRVHGHNYTVTVELASVALDPTGFVLDYGDLAPFGEWLQATLDHRDLNEVMPQGWPPTAEHLARWLFSVAHSLLAVNGGAVQVTGVRVCETANTFAEYRP